MELDFVSTTAQFTQNKIPRPEETVIQKDEIKAILYLSINSAGLVNKEAFEESHTIDTFA
jgi:hypothetical protein